MPFRVTLGTMLTAAAANDASDVHLTAGLPPLIRVEGLLQQLGDSSSIITNEWITTHLIAEMRDDARKHFEQHGEVDLSYGQAGIGRVRINVFRQKGQLAAALRLVPNEIKSIDQLGMPQIAQELALRPRGLVLVTGPTGSGKSTTLAAMVDAINDEVPAHVITIEDPIEFEHTSRTALIHQREIGSDTASFHEALRRSLRQDPDVILIGELRDTVSMEAAMLAAETGHLVLATLHTQGAAKSINRLVGAFPDGRHDQIRRQLGDTLLGIVSQTLLPRAQGRGRVVATEVMVNTPGVANLIREGDVAQLYSAMEAGAAHGMHTLDQDLRRLLQSGEISLTDAKNTGVHTMNFDSIHVRTENVDMEAWGSDESTARW